MSAPVDITPGPAYVDPADLTPAEAEQIARADQARRRATRELRISMGHGVENVDQQILAQALDATARWSHLLDAAAEPIRMASRKRLLAEHPASSEWDTGLRRGGDRMARSDAARLVIGPRIDGDRASENDLAQRGAYDQAIDRLAEILDEGGDCAVVAARAGIVVQLHRDGGR